MNRAVRFALPASLALLAATAQGQYLKTHGASLSVGGTGQFTRVLESDSQYVPNTYTTPNGTLGTDETFMQRQYTTDSAGFISSLQLHPVSWAGIAVNYGFTHYQERFVYNDTNGNNNNQTHVTNDVHEFTAGYLLHPRHIPFQPYVEVGGGSLYFAPTTFSGQFRGAGLLETGFDLPTHNQHIGFRISARSLYYRAPNFDQPAISTRSWRVTTEPAVSAFYRF